MSGALEIALIGMRAQQRALEASASNISNINTSAYKRIDMRFAELVEASSGGGIGASATGGGANGSVVGVAPWSITSLDLQGQIDPTGNPQDFAVEGAGFVELIGPGGKTLLWRGGTLRVMEDGALGTAAGQILKAGITIPQDATSVRIDHEGKVWANQGTGEGEVQVGEIGLVKVNDPSTVERLDGGVYAVNDEAGVTFGSPGEDGLGTIVQGALERSNVDLNAEMVALLLAQRAYAANSQVARAADEFGSIANGLRR
ncbi:MAG: flagellar hook-basal body protein [Novosphingobium sp.]|uniref:flagellar hook-basal body protein n=1 Tax=Novosphingobium sp. TaxID=1874826 RepID=UPI0032B79868